MKSPRVSIWKLKDAPKELRSLYHGPGTPAWIALVPRELSGRDLEDLMAESTETVSRYGLPDGSLVFVGTPAGSGVLAGAGRSKSARLGHR